MHVYGSKASPFVQRVRMAARVKGHEIELRPPPGGGMQSAEFAAISPMGRIPVLEDGDWRLCESDAIVGYLDDVLDGPSLLPEAPRERAHARQLVSLSTCEVAGAIRPIMIGKVFRMADQADVIAAAYAQAEKGLDAIERLLDPAHHWAAGDRIGIADLILVPLLALMTIIDPSADTARLIAAHPKLAAYYERAKADPIAGRSMDEMIEGFAEIAARQQQPA